MYTPDSGPFPWPRLFKCHELIPRTAALACGKSSRPRLRQFRSGSESEMLDPTKSSTSAKAHRAPLLLTNGNQPARELRLDLAEASARFPAPPA